MRTTMDTLQEKIETACQKTEPFTRARNRELSKIKWRLESKEGLCAGLDNRFGCALVLPANATVFDARDNEDLKRRFYEAALGVELTVVLLDQTTEYDAPR